MLAGIFLGDRIAELRENDGMVLRRVLETLREMDDPEAKELYGILVQHPGTSRSGAQLKFFGSQSCDGPKKGDWFFVST